jgi:hypothetical protein
MVLYYKKKKTRNVKKAKKKIQKLLRVETVKLLLSVTSRDWRIQLQQNNTKYQNKLFRGRLLSIAACVDVLMIVADYQKYIKDTWRGILTRVEIKKEPITGI